MDRKHHGPQKKLTRRLSLWQHPQWRMSSLAGVPTCWKTKQCDIDCTPTCHCWHHGGAIPRTGGAGLSFPNGKLCSLHEAGLQGGGWGQKKVFASSWTLPRQLRTESACLPRGCVLSTHHTDLDSDTVNTRSGFRTDTTVKNLRQRERKRFSLNQDQSVFLFLFFSKCDLSSCLLFCHILEGLLLGLQGGEGIYLHQITFLYTSPH